MMIPENAFKENMLLSFYNWPKVETTATCWPDTEAMSGVLTSPIWLVQAFCSLNVPLTAGNGDGWGLSGALEQADNKAKMAQASQRLQAEVNEVVTWYFLRHWPRCWPGGRRPRH